MPATLKGLIGWSAVEPRWVDATVYWVATASADGTPHVRPVDGLFVDGRLFVGGSPETRWVRDLHENQRASVHLDDGSDVAILEGDVELLDGIEPGLAARLAAESNRKYPQYGMTAESYAGPGVIAIRPRTGFAWKAFPKDLTRFRFPSDA
jgi:hypothetical protein